MLRPRIAALWAASVNFVLFSPVADTVDTPTGSTEFVGTTVVFATMPDASV